MSENRKYRQIPRFASETPWAVLASMLPVIREIIGRHLAGELLDATEIQERTAGGRAKPDPSAASGIAVLPLWGVLVPHAGVMVDVSTAGTDLDSWVAMFQAAVDDPNVAAIVLNVDSPGGSAMGVTEAATAIRNARARKPVYAVANFVTASAAYALASQATQLFASPSAIIGSVGTYSIHEDISAQLQMEGVSVEVVAAPKDGFKTELQPFGPLTEQARAHLQQQVDQYYAAFVSDVARGRGVDAVTVDATYGRGRVLTARDALSVGMVDGIASLDQVLTRLVNGQAADGRRIRAEADGLEIASENESTWLEKFGEARDAPAYVPLSLTVGDWPGTTSSGGIHSNPSLASIQDNLTKAAAEQWQVTDVLKAIETRQKATGALLRPSEAPAEEVPPPQPAATQAAPQAAETGGGTTPPTGGTRMEPVSTDRPPTLEELAAQKDEIRARMHELNNQYAGQIMDQDAQNEFDNLDGEFYRIEATMQNINERKARLEQLATEDKKRQVPGIGNGNGLAFATNTDTRKAIPENIFDLTAYRSYASNIDEMAGLWREGAKRANETLAYETDDPDAVRTRVERLLAKDSSHHPSESFAIRILGTASPLYDKAFGKLIMGRQLSSTEQLAISAAVSNTGLGAETPVPVTIDPTVINTSDGQSNPLRAIARVETITGNTWQGISSDGVTVVYDAELAEVIDQTPVFDAPRATVVKAHGSVQFSIEVDQDWGSFRSNLATMFREAKDAKEAEKFLFGTGTLEPEGLIWALDDDGTSVIDTGTLNSLDFIDLTTLISALPPRFRANAQWLGSLGTFMALSDSVDDQNNFWIPISQGFGTRANGNTGYQLKGYAANDASGMSDLVTTGGEEVLILGDFKQFLIVDRIGLNVELDPLVRNAAGRLIGARELYCYFRNTSKLLTPAAFRMLRISTS